MAEANQPGTSNPQPETTVTMTAAIGASQFQGCLTGLLVGDCFGFPYETQRLKHTFPNTLTFVQDDLEMVKLGSLKFYDRDATVSSTRFRGNGRNPGRGGGGLRAFPATSTAVKPFWSDLAKARQYTDDTSTSIAFAEFLVESNGTFDYKILSARFVQKFNEDKPKMRRDYSADTARCRQNLEFWRAGIVSLTNGSALRIAPAALLTINDPDLHRLIDLTIGSSRLTYTHPEAIVGAIFQALAVRQALLFGGRKRESNPTALKFLNALQTEFYSAASLLKQDQQYLTGLQVYQKKFMLIRDFLERGTQFWTTSILRINLGAEVEATKSIPTALFCFLAGFYNCPINKADNHFQRTLTLAMQLSDQTHTITSLAGSLCGAYVGLEGIPANFVKRCEANQLPLNLGTQLYEKVTRN